MSPYFRVLRFSPVPEFYEAINVALLLVDGRARLVADSHFSKLKCVIPSAHLGMLKFWLADMEQEVEAHAPDQAHTIIASRSAQFHLSDPHTLASGFSKNVEASLVDVFLRRRRQARNRVPEVETAFVDSRIDEVILQNSDITQARLLRNAKPHDFLSQTATHTLGTNGFKVARVFQGSRNLVVMDGINLDNPSRRQLRNKTEEVGYAFFSLGKIKSSIEASDHRHLVRAAFVFHEDRAESDRHLEYYHEILRRDADAVIDPTKQSDRNRLKEIVSAAD